MSQDTRVIRAGIDDVFEVLADGWTYSNWVTGTSHMRAVEHHWPAEGSTLFHASGIWPAVVCDRTTVEQVDRPNLLVLTARARPVGTVRVRIELHAQSATTTQVVMSESPVSGPGRWVHNPLNDLALSRRNRESLHRLACIAERRTAPDRAD